MPAATFIYFNARALGDGIRMLLAYGGQEFEDKRIPFDQWPDLKPKTPFGVLPTLEMNGKTYTQTAAMGRLLGSKYGLRGANAEEDFEIDQNYDVITDIRIKASAAFYEEDESIKKAKHEKNFFQYQEMLDRVAKMLEKNNGHVALGKLTWADFLVVGLLDYLGAMVQIDLPEKYPVFKKLREHVLSIPQVKKYIDSRPAFEMPL